MSCLCSIMSTGESEKTSLDEKATEYFLGCKDFEGQKLMTEKICDAIDALSSELSRTVFEIFVNTDGEVSYSTLRDEFVGVDNQGEQDRLDRNIKRLLDANLIKDTSSCDYVESKFEVTSTGISVIEGLRSSYSLDTDIQ